MKFKFNQIGAYMKNMSEYESLRNEIISMEEQQRNVWIYMYVIFVTLFVLGIEFSNNLFLITYVVLIPFQITINRYRWSIVKLSTYIRIFYEDKNKPGWESFHLFDEYKKHYKKMNSSLSSVVRNTGVPQLGFLSTTFYIVNLVSQKYNLNLANLETNDIFYITLSIILFIITIILNKGYSKNHIEDLVSVIQNYKAQFKKRNKI